LDDVRVLDLKDGLREQIHDGSGVLACIETELYILASFEIVKNPDENSSVGSFLCFSELVILDKSSNVANVERIIAW